MIANIKTNDLTEEHFKNKSEFFKMLTEGIDKFPKEPYENSIKNQNKKGE